MKQLTDPEKIEIRRLYFNDHKTELEIAKLMKRGAGTIHRVVSGNGVKRSRTEILAKQSINQTADILTEYNELLTEAKGMRYEMKEKLEKLEKEDPAITTKDEVKHLRMRRELLNEMEDRVLGILDRMDRTLKNSITMIDARTQTVNITNDSAYKLLCNDCKKKVQESAVKQLTDVQSS